MRFVLFKQHTMDYKLLRALSLFLQAGLVILLLMLLSLALLSCTSSGSATKATVNVRVEEQRDRMDQRFFNDLQLQRQQFKVLCINRQNLQTKQLSQKQRISYESQLKKA